MRQIYLTKALVNGNGALNVRSAGYHMASFWEIKDVSDLRYDTVGNNCAPIARREREEELTVEPI